MFYWLVLQYLKLLLLIANISVPKTTLMLDLVASTLMNRF